MTTKTRCVFFGVFLLLALSVAIPETLADGFLYHGGVYTNIVGPGDPRGINNSGEIVWSDGVVESGGTFTAISAPGAISIPFAFGINDAGQIVGQFNAKSGIFGFVDSGGTFTTISVPGAISTTAFGINDAGQIVGAYSTGSGTFGFVDNGGVFTTIIATSTGPTFAFGINNLGQIVGEDCPKPHSGQCNGFLDNGGALTTISAPGAIFTRLDGINDAGQIVGCSYALPGPCKGFLYDGGAFTTIGGPSSIPGYSEAFGINDAGKIAMTAPSTAEPGTLLLLSTGITGLLGIVRRRKSPGVKLNR
jgi:uncharacterized membrane protein